MNKNLKTIYQYFNNYSKEQIDLILTKLNKDDLDLIELRFGKDLEHPKTSELFDRDSAKKYYSSLIPKMKRLLENKTIRKYNRKVKENLEVESDTELKEKNVQDIGEIKVKEEKIQKNDEIIENEENINSSICLDTTNELPEEKVQDSYSVQTIINKNDSEITEEDYVRLVKLLSEPNFVNMMNIYTPDEVMIVSLKLGLVNEKCFTTQEISNFLGIEPDVIRNVTKKVLDDYKERLNDLIDFAINKIVDEDITLKLKKQ